MKKFTPQSKGPPPIGNLPDISYVRNRFGSLWASGKTVEEADYDMLNKVLRFTQAVYQHLPHLVRAVEELDAYDAFGAPPTPIGKILSEPDADALREAVVAIKSACSL